MKVHPGAAKCRVEQQLWFLGHEKRRGPLRGHRGSGRKYLLILARHLGLSHKPATNENILKLILRVNLV